MRIAEFLHTTKDTLSAYNRLCEPVLSRHHIPQVSFDILMFLTNHPAYRTAQEISQIRNIKKNLVSVHVEKLVQAGLLQRESIAGDRRKIGLSCTEKAAPIVADGMAVQRCFYERLRAGISQQDWEVYDRVNEIMRENTRKILEETQENEGQ